MCERVKGKAQARVGSTKGRFFCANENTEEPSPCVPEEPSPCVPVCSFQTAQRNDSFAPMKAQKSRSFGLLFTVEGLRNPMIYRYLYAAISFPFYL